MTASERAEVLDERLRRGYEDFDGQILRERREVQDQNNADRAGGRLGTVGGEGDPSGSSGSVAGGSGSGQGEGQSGSNGPEGSPQAGGAPGQTGSGGGSNAEPPPRFPPPDDIPSGRDDDVVARQLREAAMSEPDPELREKLWDEYRRYTGIDN